MSFQNNKVKRTFLDDIGIFSAPPQNAKIKKKLGFNLLKASKYAQKHNIKVSDIPLDILKKL